MKTSPQRMVLLPFFVLSGLAAVAQTQPKPPPSLHVIYLLEKEDPTFGMMNLGNEELMNQIMKTVEWGLDYTMKPIYLSKDSFTQAALKQTITGLATQPNDIIVLYYGGFSLPQRAGKFVNWKVRDAAAQGLAVADVEQWLQAKSVRLRLLIADCCASVQRGVIARDVVYEPDRRKPIIQQLFRNTCGLVKLGNLSVLENSVQDGSLFTRTLHQAFGELLLTDTTTALSTVSFQRLFDITASYMKRGSPERSPVLETTLCQTRAKPAPPTTSPPPGRIKVPAPNGLRRSVRRGQFPNLAQAATPVPRDRR